MLLSVFRRKMPNTAWQRYVPLFYFNGTSRSRPKISILKIRKNTQNQQFISVSLNSTFGSGEIILLEQDDHPILDSVAHNLKIS